MATPTTLPSTFVAGNVLTAAEMNALRGAFRVLQVVSTTKADGFTTTSGTLTDITGLSVSITPTSATSTIFVVANIHAGATASAVSSFQLLRDSTSIALSTGASSNGTFVTNLNSSVGNYPASIAFMTLDSPATTSATTYKIQTSTSAGTMRVNAHGPTGTNYGGTSSITVMEVSA